MSDKINIAEQNVREKLFEMQDLKYRDFHSSLMTNIGKERVIGVRIPNLRAFVKEYRKTEDSKEFLKILPHYYYEENNVHAFLISEIKDYDECIKMLDEFLPYVDNWATCDGIIPKCFKKNTDRLLKDINRWIKSEHVYEIRFAIKMLMTYYLDDEFDKVYPEMVAKVTHDDYYVRMMVAWYFATALAKQYEAVLPYMMKDMMKDMMNEADGEITRISEWCRKKSIQKAVESFRVSDERKEFLKSQR